MGKYHADDIKKYFSDAFGFDGSIDDSADRLLRLFKALGVQMYFDGSVTKEQVAAIPCETELTEDEVFSLVDSMLRND
jgi:hypothetical protein